MEPEAPITRLKRKRKRRSVGRPAHVPTTRFRKKVWNAAAAGFNQTVIAGMLRISLNTLVKHYAFELEHAGHELVALAATGLSDALKKRAPWALKFTLTTKGKDLGFTERKEFTGKDGQPLSPALNLDGMTREQLEALLAARRAISGKAAGNSDRRNHVADSKVGSGGGPATGTSEQGRDSGKVQDA